MAITFADLKTFCGEIASPDSSGSTAQREFVVWINSALSRLHAEFSWDEHEHERKINVPPQETGVALNVTQDSLALVLTAAETFLAKYVTEEWDLVITGDNYQTFRLASIDDSPTNQNATMRAGDEWIESTATGSTYYWIKRRFELPDNALQVVRVQNLKTFLSIRVVSSQEFDSISANNVTQRGNYPQLATFRDGKLEIWPHPGAERIKLGITYRKGPTVYTTATTDATEIEWPDHWLDLLQKAISLEAAVTQGADAPIPYKLARVEFEDALRRYKGIDNNKYPITGQINMLRPRMSRSPITYSHHWPVGPDED